MKRKWGQHFLASTDIARRIVEPALIDSQDVVVEVGPGHGELTRHYIERARKTFLIEVDPRLCEKLKDRWRSLGDRVIVINQDIREVDFKNLAPDKPPVVLGNLPYYVSKPIVSWLIEWGKFDRAVLMLQQEVVDRLVARPGDSEYSLFTVLFSLRAEGRVLMTVGPEHFRPPPKVKSCVIEVRPKKPAAVNFSSLEKLLKAAFTSRRQKLINSLARSLPGISKIDFEKALTASEIPVSARAQEVSGDSFIRLLENLGPDFGASRSDLV